MAVTVRTGPISAQDNPADIPVEKWRLLVDARRGFAKVELPYDCRELLRFVEEMRTFDMVAKLGYADEDDFIRRGLELDPEIVREALVMLKRMKPEWAVPFQAAADIGRTLRAHGGDRKSEARKNQACNTRLKSFGSAEHIRARLKRDGHDALLAQVERGEKSANAAAVEMGWRARMIQCAATVDGFTRAILTHLNPDEQVEVIEEVKKRTV
jgi:hypothetical protein